MLAREAARISCWVVHTHTQSRSQESKQHRSYVIQSVEGQTIRHTVSVLACFGRHTCLTRTGTHTNTHTRGHTAHAYMNRTGHTHTHDRRHTLHKHTTGETHRHTHTRNTHAHTRNTHIHTQANTDLPKPGPEGLAEARHAPDCFRSPRDSTHRRNPCAVTNRNRRSERGWMMRG